VPVTLPIGTVVTAVVAGGTHSVALTSDGSVLTWGNNFIGELGNGTMISSDIPVAASLPGGTTVIALAAGPAANHTLVVAS
jgi:alpha-tubulin suppressor-like RCC1 family protein